jgi:hypothetical protein
LFSSSILNLLDVINAISSPEKNADAISVNRIMTTDVSNFYFFAEVGFDCC